MIESLFTKGLPISIYSFPIFLYLIVAIYPKEKKRSSISPKYLKLILRSFMLYVVLQAIFYNFIAFSVYRGPNNLFTTLPFLIASAGIIISVVNVVIAYGFFKKIDLKKTKALETMLFRILISIIPLLISALFLVYFL